MPEATTICSLCGAPLPASKSCLELRDELFAYTLAHGGSEFLHQHVVDAYAAQHITGGAKPIYQAAALVGLYLFVERGETGRQAQRAHMALGNKMKDWRLIPAPVEHASLTVMDPLSVPPGPDRDESIKQWAQAVWATWRDHHKTVEGWLQGKL